MSSPSLSSSFRRNQVIKAARKLLEAAGVREPPVDVVRLARLQGVTDIREEPLGTTDAELIPTATGFEIVVNSDIRSVQRKRFSIAHEIAHTFFRPQTKAFRHRTVRVARKRAELPYRIEEILCNAAAQEMLMPEELFRRHAYFNPPSIPEIRRLAELFDTSLEATALRYSHFLTEVQVNKWSGGSGEIEINWTAGTPIVELRKLSDEAPNPFIESLIQSAYVSSNLITDVGTDPNSYPLRRLWIQAQGFGNGGNRFVLSLMRSACRSPQMRP